MAPKEVKLKKNNPKLTPDFRVLRADGCGAAFHAPVEHTLSGENVRSTKNTVHLRVASIPDFLLMKAHAIAGRDKPKDSYDFCYCLEHFPDGMTKLAEDWRNRARKKDVATAVKILREKFGSVGSFGPQQLVEFQDSPNTEEQAMHARRAYELVQRFLDLIS